MITAIVLIGGSVLVGAVVFISGRNPLGHGNWKWWELTAGSSPPIPSHARSALARPKGIGLRRSLTVVRVCDGSRHRVWVSFLSKGDDSDLVAQLAIAAGCNPRIDASAPQQIYKRRWRLSHIIPAAGRAAMLSPSEADGLARTIDGFLHDGDAIITTVRWAGDRQVKARTATTSSRLGSSWTHEASTATLPILPTPLAIVPLLVLIAALAVVAHSYFELPAWLDRVLESAAGSPSTPVAAVAICVAAHSAARLMHAIFRPRLVSRAQRCWHLPLGWRTARNGGTIGVEHLAGWARARP
ncbi:hypothetical protein [Candidatus Poriferisodalis sp.]|uniref:hypothetical protein n=1 Tax=Candidatus Poriferisodalis sp. TaxID=3101277 RepID=UPI003B01F414